MRAYLAIFRLRFINVLQYRAAAIAGIATQFFWGFMYIMIFEAFYRTTGGSNAITFTQLTTYIWLQQAFLMLVYIFLKDNDILDAITSGNVAYELCRPCSVYKLWYAKLIAQRAAGTVLRCAPLIAFSVFLPAPYNLNMPKDMMTFALFCICLLLALFLIVSISMLIYISIFVTTSATGSYLMFGVIGEFLSGFIIPVPFMPDWLQGIVYLLPFRLTADLPFRIYSGNIPVQDAIYGILMQLIWISILVIVGNWYLSKILKKIVIQGG